MANVAAIDETYLPQIIEAFAAQTREPAPIPPSEKETKEPTQGHLKIRAACDAGRRQYGNWTSKKSMV